MSAVYLFMPSHSHRKSEPECRGEVAEGGDRKGGQEIPGERGLCLDPALENNDLTSSFLTPVNAHSTSETYFLQE